MNKRLSFLILFCFSIVAMNATAQGCPDSCSFYLPTTLTPDCDGVDCDVLEVVSNCTFTKFDFTIYNRWGEIIYHSLSSKERFLVGDHEDGTYLWQLKCEFCNSESIEQTGYIHIIR